MELGRPDRDPLELVSLLRNTIHGQALETIAFIDTARGRGERYPLVVPAKLEAEFVDVARRCGGLRRLGLERLPGGGPYLLDIDAFVETALPRVIGAVDRVCAIIEVERIAGAAKRALGVQMNDVWGQLSAVQWLTGFPVAR